MIEEAAGLSLFKGRRDLSERKLERVRENLARVDDVLSEIERQLNYARRQARKAEAYKLIKAELSQLERWQAARRILDQRVELAAETGRASELGERAESMRANLGELQGAVESASFAAQQAESEFAAARRELESIHAGAQQRSRTRDFLARRLQAIDESEPANAARLAELGAQAIAARAARAAAGSALAREANAGDGGAAELEARKAAYADAQSALKAVERRAEELKDDLSDTVREAAVIRGRLGDLAGERAELQERLAASESEAPALAQATAAAEELMRAAQETLGAARAELEALEDGHRADAEREIEAHAALEHLGARIAALKEAIEAARRQMQATAQSRDAVRPLKTVLESMNGDRPPVEPELLVNVVRAPAELKPALAAVLGDDLEAVIVESPQFAVRAIEILKEKNAGRMSFVPEPDAAAVAASTAIEAPGVAGRLIDMIGVDPRYRAVVEVMLGNVMLADDVLSALNASNLNGHGTLFVTREGDLVSPGRVIRGGSADQSRAASLGGDIQPLHETAAELVRAQAEHEILRERLAERASARARSAAALAESRTRAHDAERAALAARGDAASAAQKTKLAHSQLDGARRRLAEIRELCADANARLEALALAEAASRAQLGERRESSAAQRAALEEVGAAMLEAAARVDARRAQIAALEQEFRHATRIAHDLEAQIDEGDARLILARRERAEFEAELAKLAAQEREADAREAELSGEIARLKSECAERALELDARRAELKGAQARLHACETEAVECGLKCERARTLIEELLRNFIEKFAAEFDTVAEELAAAIATRDSMADDARVAELRAKAERIGEVNLAAESEVKELEERAATLSAERADLEAAVKDLTQTIARLNKEARKRFAETFEGAAKNFEDLLPKLLPGGRGRLELEDAPDMLEAGVNILVQPAGKKVKEIGLLSGGEKALSAMALIFALFLLNPSPFCVMDEVDAPLDEFRLNAFTGLLAELKARSQFIVITHNQRTMQRADHIHGVTMASPGVSRVISLKIPKAA